MPSQTRQSVRHKLYYGDGGSATLEAGSGRSNSLQKTKDEKSIEVRVE